MCRLNLSLLVISFPVSCAYFLPNDSIWSYEDWTRSLIFSESFGPTSRVLTCLLLLGKPKVPPHVEAAAAALPHSHWTFVAPPSMDNFLPCGYSDHKTNKVDAIVLHSPYPPSKLEF